MRVNSVSNVSVGAKKVKAPKNNVKKEQYFKWVSQHQTNQTLKMTKGREVENGKFEAAKAVSTLVAIGAGIFTIFNSVKTGNMEKAAKEITPQIAKMKNQNLAALAVTAVALNARNVIDSINRSRADKTANERGFLTNRQVNMAKNLEQTYNLTNTIYNNNVH